ncbi:hypothetical protein ACMU_02155 [Actibacterium mucosum KCTC 23349]|uniref:Flagellin C-terminal domain-containing protein n=1 Tax=Actibacterium mucosum KCTC 23349 TaxID=1454373 RepID=A0A037ZNT6_9RHOB|nr:flagellin [Actibacterium mucosum]KAJ57325.1 hypothetical protein ACMU_02155 [Actibacterium mucosum KCTC 23349]
MALVSLGDMAYQFALSRQNTTLKQGLQTSTQELTTGVSADLGARLSGDFGPLSAMERSLATIQSYSVATTEARLTADAMQVALGNVTDNMRGLQEPLLLAGSEPQATLIRTAGIDAQQKFAQAVSTLNSSVAGRSLFAGSATDTAALVDSETILAHLRALIGAQATADGVADAVNAWFHDAGGGFETVAYQGAAHAAGPMRLADDQILTLDITAESSGIRDVLAGLATAALLADDDLLEGDPTQRSALAKHSAEALLSAEDTIASLRADLGAKQERIEDIEVQNATAVTALEIARADLIGVDPYEAATRLEALQTQIETLYTVTSRVSRLNLADFLR